MPSISTTRFFILLLVLLFKAALACAQGQEQNLHKIRALLEKPEKEIDLARSKLVIDHMIDPSIDIEGTLRQLDTMADQVRMRLPRNASSLEKMEALVRHLYVSGSWNGYRPFKYDLDDPYGSNIQNKLLPTYLKTRRGNCVSMPFLFIVLGQKLGIDVTASTVPRHIFVKYRLDDGIYRNFEATSGGAKLDASYQREMRFTDLAIKNGMYLKPLSKRESISVMLGTLMEFYDQVNRQEWRVELGKLALKYYPMNDAAMLGEITAYMKLMEQEFVTKFPTPADIPFELRDRYLYLGRSMDMWRDRVSSAGWRMSSEAAERNYAQQIKQVKAMQ